MLIDELENLPLGYAAASINHVVAVLFPPHPSAVSPSEELGLSVCLCRADRKLLNYAFGLRKLTEARINNVKNR